MAKIYKDYEDKYVANNLIYMGISTENEMVFNISDNRTAALASITPTEDPSGNGLKATRIDKDTFIDLFSKGAIIFIGTATDPDYFIPYVFGIATKNDVRYAYAKFTNAYGSTSLLLSEEAYDLDLRTFIA